MQILDLSITELQMRPFREGSKQSMSTLQLFQYMLPNAVLQLLFGW